MLTVRAVQAVCFLIVRAALASVTIEDPSDIVPASDWAADNAIVPDYDVPFPAYQPSPSESIPSFLLPQWFQPLPPPMHRIHLTLYTPCVKVVAKYVFEANSTSLDHETYTVNANDTSVILVSEEANLDLSFVDVIKYGYSSNLDYSSFWGFNAAINVVSSF